MASKGRRPNETVVRNVASQPGTGGVEIEENIFLFVPNLIGYLRVILAIGSLYFMPLHPRRCSALYSVSCLLDALDGFAARKLKQSTRFGSVLDMVTDRCTTTCLLVFLAIAKPTYAVVFQSLISLDFTSHYMHMYATLVMHTPGKSHKIVSAKRSWIMNFYYQKWVLFVCCAGNELFFIGLYLLCFSSPNVNIPLLSWSLFSSDTTPAKFGISSTPESQDIPSSTFPVVAMEMARLNKLNDSIPRFIMYISAPIMLFKQYVNIEQLIKASQGLAEVDRKERKAKKLGKIG